MTNRPDTCVNDARMCGKRSPSRAR
jgi:hypothetical protein